MSCQRLSKAFLKSINISPTAKPLSKSIFHLSVNDNSIPSAKPHCARFFKECLLRWSSNVSQTWCSNILLGILSKAQVALEDKNVYLCQKAVITMKNQVWPVCSTKDKIWSRPDKLQRCRRLPLEQTKLRQILENKSEGVLIRKWFDRWYVAESLCNGLRGKIDYDLISQPILPVRRICTISTGMDLSLDVKWSRKR